MLSKVFVHLGKLDKDSQTFESKVLSKQWYLVGKGCFKNKRNKQCNNEKICHQNNNFLSLRKEEVVKMKWKASSSFLGSSEEKGSQRSKIPIRDFFRRQSHLTLIVHFFQSQPNGLMIPLSPFSLLLSDCC